MLPAMPDSLRMEHEQLREDLEQAIRIGGRIGEAARVLQSLLRPHFRREDDNVFLGLGLLNSVAQGKVTPGMYELVVKAEQLKRELPEMLAEHNQIRRAVERLGQEATGEGRSKVAGFAATLLNHARRSKSCTPPPSCWVNI